jgi:hypothetical protein
MSDMAIFQQWANSHFYLLALRGCNSSSLLSMGHAENAKMTIATTFANRNEHDQAVPARITSFGRDVAENDVAKQA